MNTIIKTMIAIKTILTKINYYTPPSDSKYPSCLEFTLPERLCCVMGYYI